MSADTSTTADPPDAVTASIVSGNGASPGAYPMFRARDISSEGAFLMGGLFLEVDEEFIVELSLGDDSVRATARVVRLEEDGPGMRVTFSGLSDADRDTLKKRAENG